MCSGSQGAFDSSWAATQAAPRVACFGSVAGLVLSAASESCLSLLVIFLENSSKTESGASSATSDSLSSGRSSRFMSASHSGLSRFLSLCQRGHLVLAGDAIQAAIGYLASIWLAHSSLPVGY